MYKLFNALTAVGALMTLIDFTLSNASCKFMSSLFYYLFDVVWCHSSLIFVRGFFGALGFSRDRGPKALFLTSCPGVSELRLFPFAVDPVEPWCF